MKQPEEEGVAADGGCNVRAASLSDLPERAYSGSAWAEVGEKVGRVCAARRN